MISIEQMKEKTCLNYKGKWADRSIWSQLPLRSFPQQT